MQRIVLSLLFASLVSAAHTVPAQTVWALQDSGTTAGLRGIDSVDGKVGWANGTGGTVLRTLDDRARTLLADVGLAGYADALAAELSYGRKRALEIATTLALDPALLLLDEPMAGMGREDIAGISALIKTVAAARTVLMVEHNLSVVADLCDRITVLTRGRVLAEGDYATVSADPAVREAYLGTGHA